MVKTVGGKGFPPTALDDILSNVVIIVKLYYIIVELSILFSLLL